MSNVPGLIKAPTDEWLAMKEEEAMDISLCNNCHCMTHTIKGKCGKCKVVKK